MKNENFINIQGWMINELNLKGNELILYAIIFGFSQDGQSEYFGSQRYIAEAMKVSLPTANKLINKLLEKGYIHKTQESHYIAVKESLTPPLKKVKQQRLRKFNDSVKESLTNNNTNNKILNSNNNKKLAKVEKIEFDVFYEKYPLKKGKQIAATKWKKLTIEEQKQAIADIPNRLANDKLWRQGVIPFCSTYVNQKRWTDEIDTSAPVRSFNKPKKAIGVIG